MRISYGQWVRISSEKINSSFSSNTGFHLNGGILTVQNGLILFGFGDTMRISNDNGQTWRKTKPDLLYGGANLHARTIYDIDFYDKFNGFVSHDQGASRTRDGGKTWVDASGVTYSIRYLNPLFEYFGVAEDNRASLTTNINGTIFFSDSLKSSFAQLRKGEDKIYFNGALPTSKSPNGHIYYTTYSGKWTELPGDIDFDCFSFGIDSCNEKLFVVVNEETFGKTDGIAGIYVSIDGGNTFSFHKQTQDREYYCGSISVAPEGIIFAQTMEDGVLRSTDLGQTWISIGGPNGLLDSRLVCAVTPDLIYAADDSGNVWMTTNSGGFPTGIEYTRFETPEKISTDTIGGDIHIPITINSQSIPQDVTLQIFFGNNKNLVYQGTTSITGTSLDIPGTTTSTSSQILIPKNEIKPGSVVAYSNLNLFADTMVTSMVSFNLLQAASQKIQCANLQSATALTGPIGCGIEKISTFLRTSNILSISSVFPNPSQEKIEFYLYSMVNQEVNVEIINNLGIVVYSNLRSIDEGSSLIHLDTDNLSQGVYLVRVSSIKGMVSQTFVKVDKYF